MKLFTGAFALLQLDTIIKPSIEYLCINGHERPLGRISLTHCLICQTPYKPRLEEYYANGYEVLGGIEGLIDIEGYSIRGLDSSQMIIISDNQYENNCDFAILNQEKISNSIDIFSEKYENIISQLPHVKGYKICFGAFIYEDER